jgi:hypothetical protein
LIKKTSIIQPKALKVLLFLNGPEGSQIGQEDGFGFLKSIGKISDLNYYYLEDFINKNSNSSGFEEAEKIAEQFQPNLIVLFHISTLKISYHFIMALKNLSSKPIIAYDEGDMYGSWAKPMTSSMKKIIKHADVVSVRGLGNFGKQVAKINKNFIYTPHHAELARFNQGNEILTKRKYDIVFIGNRITSRLALIRRLPGAKQREKFVAAIGKEFGDRFMLFGNGWDKFTGNAGPVNFDDQVSIYSDTWVTLAYEHYPKIPYYFSNRLPIALMAGSLYVCHYHEGYDFIFKNCDFIFFYKNNQQAIDIIRYINSLNKSDLLERSKRAKAFAYKYFHPSVVWNNFFDNVFKIYNDNN